jgi:hypothetical protein
VKHAHIVANESLPHHASWGGAFGEGLARHGWRITHGAKPDACDLLVMWGVRRQEWIWAQKADGGEVCILERGYVGDRFVSASVSFGGGLNGRGTFRGPMHDGGRWRRHFAHLMQPWRGEDDRRGYALLVGQVPGDQSLAGVNIDRWYYQTLLGLRRFGREVRFRPHPRAVELGRAQYPSMDGVVRASGDLADVLRGAGLVVTFNSNTAVESVLAGVPTIAMDEGSMAWPVTGHAVGEIVTPDRTPWAHWLAWCQWTMDEMRSGDCWAAVGAD